MAKMPDSNTENSPCQSCPAHSSAALVQQGIDMSEWDYVVALAGNPNVGKSTVFNALTGLRQHTGNWPGKTVSRAEGGFTFGQNRYKLIDLPGTYSLLSTSFDEEIARDFILFGRPDVTVVVVDATRLERNLNLVLQVLEITDRVVIALNLMDEANRHGISINERRLARDLGVPVVPTIARQKEGLEQLIQMIDEVASGKIVCRPHRLNKASTEVAKAIKAVESEVLSVFPSIPNARWVAMRLLDGDPRITQAILNDEFGEYRAPADEPSDAAMDLELGLAS